MTESKIRIKVKSFDHIILEEATKKLVQVVIKSGGRVVGPVPLKTKKKKVTLRRATFVYSKHADTVAADIHKRLIDIYEVNNEVVNNLSTMSLPAGVDVVIETIPLEQDKDKVKS